MPARVELVVTMLSRPGAVICGVDESEAAASAARVAARLAAAAGAGLVLVHVAPAPAPSGRSLVGAHERAQRRLAFDTGGYMQTVLTPIEVEGVDAERVVEFGEVAEVLRETAVARGAWLLVVGSRGTTSLADVLLGSTCRAVLERAPRPVVVARTGADDAAFEGPVVCGVDGSPEAERAAEEAAILASRLRVALALCNVDGRDAAPLSPPGYAAGVEVERVRRSGPVADELIALGRERNAAVIAAGSRGRGAVAATILGSVSQALVARADRPVMVVPPAG